MDEIVDSMDLTAKEVEMILEYRAKQAKIAKAKEQTQMLLDYAAMYNRWLVEKEESSTHGKFCNDWKAADTTLLQDRSEAYNAIMTIIGTAKEYAAGKGMIVHQ